MRLQFLVALSLLPALASAAPEAGWAVANGKVYQGAREACEAFLRETQSGGVKYVIDRMEPNAAGDVQYCYHKNANDDGKAVSYTLIFRVERDLGDDKKPDGKPDAKADPKGSMTLYRGTTAARRTEATTFAQFDLGAGVYYALDQASAKIHAQARWLDAWAAQDGAATPAIPDAIILEVKLDPPKDSFLDISEGADRTSFETHLRRNPVEYSEYVGGQLNPRTYHTRLTEWLGTAKKKQPTDLRVIVVFDPRIGGKLARINDTALVATLDRGAKQVGTARAPTHEEIKPRVRNIATPVNQEACAISNKAGDCEPWSSKVGKLLFVRYGWRAIQHKAEFGVGNKIGDGKEGGNHTHLRIGDILLDGTFMQFDLDAVKTGKKELFIGTADQLRKRLGFIQKPKYASHKNNANKMFADLWDGPPRLLNKAVPQLTYRPSGAVDWYN